MTRRICKAGLGAIKASEALRLKAYRDIAGVLTIGWGHTKGVYPGQEITEEQAESYLRDDLAEAEAAIDRLVKVPLSDLQFAALVSWAFNVGVGAAAKSTLIRKLNAGDYDAVPSELARWNKARVNGKLTVSKGLVNRRAAEAAMWAAASEMEHEPAAVAESGDRRSPAQSRTVLASLTQAGTAIGGVTAGAAALDGTAQIVLIAGGVLIAALALFILRERLVAWADGRR